MSKMTFTPGPWQATGRIVEADPERDGNECVIALVGMGESARNDADARLIAAAPELLEACEAMRIYLEEVAPERNDAPEFWGMLDQARAAIAKAKGEL